MDDLKPHKPLEDSPYSHPVKHRNVAELDVLIGRTVESIDKDDETMALHLSDGTAYLFFHENDCCEHVRIEEIIGDLDDMVGSPIIMSEMVSSEIETNDGSQTWTFYKFATQKGFVTVRWLGESNGYYSEEVDFVRIK